MWRTGGGKDLALGGKEWSDYLLPSLSAELRAKLEMLFGDNGLPLPGHRFNFKIHGDTDQSGWSTGLELLHGTNWYLGGLEVHGSADWRKDEFGQLYVHFTMSVVFNDRVDPN